MEDFMTIASTNTASLLTGASTSNSSGGTNRSSFGSLTANDFMKMLITELQTQDPTQPMKNENLLTQLSTMRNLQANVELSDAMQSITTNQQLATAANFIGKLVAGTDDQSNPITGKVDRAFLNNGTAYVGIGNTQLALSNVSTVSIAG
jgi:flagellar basal-body rod modification protein FlgD